MRDIANRFGHDGILRPGCTQRRWLDGRGVLRGGPGGNDSCAHLCAHAFGHQLDHARRSAVADVREQRVRIRAWRHRNRRHRQYGRGANLRGERAKSPGRAVGSPGVRADRRRLREGGDADTGCLADQCPAQLLWPEHRDQWRRASPGGWRSMGQRAREWAARGAAESRPGAHRRRLCLPVQG